MKRYHPLRHVRKFLGLLMLFCGALQAQAQTPAQVGMSRLMAGDLPVTLVYPTQVAEAPLALGPFVLNVALDAAPAWPAHRRPPPADRDVARHRRQRLV